jgi:hypothetical protein
MRGHRLIETIDIALCSIRQVMRIDPKRDRRVRVT